MLAAAQGLIPSSGYPPEGEITRSSDLFRGFLSWMAAVLSLFVAVRDDPGQEPF